MSLRVLIIEDNEQNLYLLTFLLERHRYIVYCASNGPAGIEKALRELPDMILLDIQLPGMDGYEVARKLQSFPELRNTPIVAVTSYAMPGDRERFLSLGCSGYIEKPINPETFVDEINAYMHGDTTAEYQRDEDENCLNSR